MNYPQQPDRRHAQRIKKNFILTYYEFANPQKKFAASQVKNISMGGMCFVTSQPFAIGTLLAIELKTPFLSQLTHLEGKVLESHERVKNIIYETRIAFIDMTPQGEFVLKEVVEHFLKDPGKYYEEN